MAEKTLQERPSSSELINREPQASHTENSRRETPAADGLVRPNEQRLRGARREDLIARSDSSAERAALRLATGDLHAQRREAIGDLLKEVGVPRSKKFSRVANGWRRARGSPALVPALPESADLLQARPVVQLRPVLPLDEDDQAFVDLLTTGHLLPDNCTITDERTREGATQQLSMLSYTHGAHRVYVHIHIAEGTFFGHVIMGQTRLHLAADQSRQILDQAQAAGIDVEYRDPPRRARHETGEYGHEAKRRT